eukprot:4550052-Prymnesium_polylepis.1
MSVEPVTSDARISRIDFVILRIRTARQLARKCQIGPAITRARRVAHTWTKNRTRHACWSAL